jgi:glycosyltransferase involved in cell wall biosynthesis
MAAGIPPVASPVGVNSNIIETGKTGFLATAPEEWEDVLIQLIVDPSLRSEIGQNGYQFVCQNYDYGKWSSFFSKAIAGCFSN